MSVLISLQNFSEIFLILERVQLYIIISVSMASCKAPVIFVRF
jgi:hypothetical protein